MSSSNERIRVLWLVKGLGPGGMERLLVHHARVGDRSRFDYQVGFLVDRPGSLEGELRDAGVECVRLAVGRSVDPRWVGSLRALVRDRGVDIVHAHSPQPAAMARPVLRAMRGGPRLVYTEHNTWDCYGWPTRALNAATYPLDDATFAVSTDARDSVPSVLRRKVEVLTHGIELGRVGVATSSRAEVRSSLGIAETDRVVITVAHLRTEKAHEVLLAAAAQVVERRSDVVFLAVGHGPREPDLADLHRRLGLGDRVRFLGFRDDVPSLLAASDVFCLSSHQEGLPVAFMEAGALGLPSVVTAVGGLVDHIDSDHDGMLVPPGDPDALAAALLRILDDRQLRAQLGRRAREHAQVFDASVAVRRQEAIYSRLCGRATAPLGSS